MKLFCPPSALSGSEAVSREKVMFHTPSQLHILHIYKQTTGYISKRDSQQAEPAKRKSCLPKCIKKSQPNDVLAYLITSPPSPNKLGFRPVPIPAGQLAQKCLKVGGVGTDSLRLSLLDCPQLHASSVDAVAAPEPAFQQVSKLDEIAGTKSTAGLQQCMPPIGSSILQQGCGVCNLLHVTCLRQIEEILDL